MAITPVLRCNMDKQNYEQTMETIEETFQEKIKRERCGFEIVVLVNDQNLPTK